MQITAVMIVVTVICLPCKWHINYITITCPKKERTSNFFGIAGFN